MAIYNILGGKELSGTISVGGSKNATLPIICGTLLTSEQCVLKNVPQISDVDVMIQILQDLGSKIVYEKHTLTIDNSGVNSYQPKAELVKKLRGSILMMGPLLARFKKVVMPVPGGDLIGKRPIDAHLMGMRELGATVIEGENLELSTDKLVGQRIILPEMSVTATENIIMAAVLAEGLSTVHLAATEPHVQDLCRMLNAMGAKISGVGTHDLKIEGVKELHGVEHTIIFDNEVASSYINLAAATKSEVTIDNIQPDYLNGALIQWKMMNVNFEITNNSVRVKKPIGAYKAATIKTSIYPGLLTDYVPPFAVLATQAEGTSLIHEWMYEGRLGYIHELSKMGAKVKLLDPHRAEIIGSTQLHGTNVSSLDVRSGMVCVIAALVAEGKSVLHDVEHIERGYEGIVEKLKSLGADITRYEH
ncbi:MAG: UDP-N-acetylglucosamine 1-carboxyvinyltransferase, UDP-N-acetylglucosamine 1-carboxyvinyltransferase [Candidatus Doudnabacteria bacterium]|nr:UDP-N-acetylglucosamine 1-carboxyvinyltransferase, UDP-N-acetylglucosamine 1-carboxyvinyltransferase [Candidatus Doudnabacteria bacterium]